MAVGLPVYVFGNGQLIEQIFNAIVMSTSSSAYQSLITMTLLFATFMVSAQYISKRNAMVKVNWLAQYFLIYSILFVPTTTILIHDRVYQSEGIRQVEHVPVGIATLAYLATSIGYGLTELMEQNFSLVDDLSYHKTGMVMASQLVTTSSEFRITDPDFASNIENFMHQCVFYDLYLEKYTMKDLLTTDDMWGFISSKASKARAFVYKPIAEANTSTEEASSTESQNSSKGSFANPSQIVTCADGASRINRLWRQIIDEAGTMYGSRLFPSGSKVDVQTKAEFMKYLPISYQKLAGISNDATSILKQILTKNAFEDSVRSLGPTLDSSSAMESFAFIKAQQQKRLTNKTLLQQAPYWLPMMKNVVECILYGSFVFVFLFSLLPGGIATLKNYFISVLWIQLWAPLYAIVNLMMTSYAQYKTQAMADGGLSLMNMSGIAQVNSDMEGLAGWIAMSVPMISLWLLKYSAVTLTSVAQQLGGLVQSSATASASEVASGNISMGNMSLANSNAYNASAFHVDRNARIAQGMFSEQLDSGAMRTTTPSGEYVLDASSAISKLPTSVNISDALTKSFTASAKDELSTAQSQQAHYGESWGNTLQNVHDLSSFMGKSANVGHGSSISMSARDAQAFNTVHDMIEKTAKNNNIDSSELVRSLANYHAGGDLSGKVDTDRAVLGTILKRTIGASLDLQGKFGTNYSWDSEGSQRQGQSFSAAKELMQDKRFTESLDTALQATQSHSFNANNDEGAKLVNSLNTNYAHATQLRHDVSSHLQQARNYAEMANLAASHGESINTNATQDFYQWMQRQSADPMNAGRMSGRTVDQILTGNPEIAQNYAMQYVHEKQQAFMQEMKRMEAGEVAGISDRHEIFQQHLPNANEIKSDNMKQRMETDLQAKHSHGINLDKHLPDPIGHGVKSSINEVGATISREDHNIKKEEDTIKKESHKQFDLGLNKPSKIKPLDKR